MRLLAFILGSALSFGAVAQATDKPSLNVGDRWVYRTIDLWKNEEVSTFEYAVTGVAGDNVELAYKVLSSKNPSEVGSTQIRKATISTWTLLNSAILEGQYVALAFPLSVGKSWEHRYRVRARTTPSDVEREIKAAVEGWEPVTVPAGQFNALKVIHHARWTNNAPSGVFYGTYTETFWYVPEVKRYVKYEYIERTPTGQLYAQNRVELLRFDLKR